MVKQNIKALPPVKHDGISFNRSFLMGFRSEDAFLRAMKNEAYAHIYKGENREAKLKELYAIVRPKPIEPEK